MRTSEAQAGSFVLQDVGRRWGTREVLAGVSLTIEAGERIAIVGPSGGGKSTLLKLLAGRLRPSEGVVKVHGQSLSSMSRQALQGHRLACAYMEQGGQMYPGLSVFRNVQAGRIAGWPWWRATLAALWPLEQADVRAALAKVGLEERCWDAAEVLSGGQQQRVAIARALHTSPQALLVDEPTAALDPTTAHEMVAALLAHQEAQGATLVWCTHWLSLIQPHMTRVLGIREGRLAFDLAPEEITEGQLAALYEGTEEHVR